ncbi:MAG: DMT family transporter [Marinosulfonomonas sp.]
MGTARNLGKDGSGGTRSEALGYGAGLTTWILTASVFVVAKAVEDEVPPFTMAFMRSFILFLIMMPLVSKYHPEMRVLFRQRWREILFIGALGLGLTQAALYTAIDLTAPVNVSIVFALAPMVTMILARLVLGEAMNGWQALGSATAFIGIVVISVHGSWGLLKNLQFGLGEMIAFGASLTMAGYTVLLKRAKFPLPPLPMLAMLVAGGTLILFPLAGWEFATGQHENLSTRGWIALLYCAVIGGGLNYTCYNWSVEILGATRAGTLAYSQMVFVAIFAWIFLGEGLHWYHYLGASFVATGILLVVAMRPKPQAQT